MKRTLLTLWALLVAQLAYSQYPTALDQNTTAGQTLRAPLAAEAQGSYSGSPVGTANPDLPTWLSNASTSLIGLENVVGLPGSSVTTSHDYKISKLQSNIQITPSVTGPIFWVGASYEDELNSFVINGNTAPYPVSSYSDGNSWAHLVSAYFGQPCLGRYAGPAGSLTGTNYSVAGAGSFTGTYSVPNQISQLITDHGGTLPSGSIVVLGGYWPNDLTAAIETYGGAWTTEQSWQVGTSGSFTTLNSGTQTIVVVSTTGMVAGTNNFISFNNNYVVAFPISAVVDSTHVTISGVSGLGGIVVPNSANIQVSAYAEIRAITGASFGNISGAITNLVAALPSNGLIVICTSPDVSLIPAYTVLAESVTNVHNTWLWYKNTIIAPLFSVTTGKIASYDMSQALVDVVTNYPPIGGVPSKYGFKTVGVGMGGTYLVPVPTGLNPGDYAFWDGTTAAASVHPTSAMQRKYAIPFIEFLKIRGYVSPY
jgi:hypothetical protein